MEEKRYRHEYKYPLTHGQALIENAKINAVASRDSHTGADGSYQIRSLYFDDYQNSCYMSNENGVDERERSSGSGSIITVQSGSLWSVRKSIVG